MWKKITDHRDWVKELIGSDSMRTACARIGLPPSALSQQITRTGRVTCENVIHLAVEYGADPVAALVDTGYLPAGATAPIGVADALTRASDTALVEEVLRRLRAAHEAGTVIEFPAGDDPATYIGGVAAADRSPDEPEGPDGP